MMIQLRYRTFHYHRVMCIYIILNGIYNGVIYNLHTLRTSQIYIYNICVYIYIICMYFSSLDTSPYWIHSLQYFILVCSLSFILLTRSSTEKHFFFNFNKIHPIYQSFLLWIRFLASNLRTLCWALDPEDFLQFFFQKVLHLVFKSMICFELIFI